MNFLTNFLSSLRPAGRRRFVRPSHGARRSDALMLEQLENRWAPAVDITGLGTDSVSIVDSDEGKINNSIVVIDDIATQTTYIRVNNGPETQLGASGKLLADLSILMGAGNDKVSFVVRNATEQSVALDTYVRFVNLGAGKDSLSIDLGDGTGFANSTIAYSVVDEGGNDSYTLKGNVYSAQLSLVIPAELSGDDKYNFNLKNTGDGSTVINVTDSSGNDRYKAYVETTSTLSGQTMTLLDLAGDDRYDLNTGGSYISGALTTTINDAAGSDTYKIATPDATYSAHVLTLSDLGTGKNKLEVRQANLTNNAVQNLNFVFMGDSNWAKFYGDATITNGSSVAVLYQSLLGTNEVSYNDSAVTNSSASTFTMLGSMLKDDVRVRLNGVGKNGTLALGSASTAIVNCVLNDGDDQLTVRLYGKQFVSRTDAVGGNILQVIADLGAGNDRASLKTVQGPLAGHGWLGGETQFLYSITGNLGDDQIDVDLGRIQGELTRFTIMINAGAGADKVTLGGELTSTVYNFITVTVGLGNDIDVDVFKSSLTAKSSTMNYEQFFAILESLPGTDQLVLSTKLRAVKWSFGI